MGAAKRLLLVVAALAIGVDPASGVDLIAPIEGIAANATSHAG